MANEESVLYLKLNINFWLPENFTFRFVAGTPGSYESFSSFLPGGIPFISLPCQHQHSYFLVDGTFKLGRDDVDAADG